MRVVGPRETMNHYGGVHVAEEGSFEARMSDYLRPDGSEYRIELRAESTSDRACDEEGDAAWSFTVRAPLESEPGDATLAVSADAPTDDALCAAWQP